MIYLKEVWKDISEYVGYYQVSNFGNVRSVDRVITDCNGKTYFKHGKNMKFGNNGVGYMFVALCKFGKYKLVTVHRLVATAFIPNPDNLPVINHIDGNKLNNNVDNLEWCTTKENIHHAIRSGLVGKVSKESRKHAGEINSYKQGKRVLCTTTGEVFQSMKIASTTLNIPLSCVSRSVYRNRPYCGYKFELLDASKQYKPIDSGVDLRTIKKKIYCITTGKLYDSADDASIDCHLHRDTIRRSAKNNKRVGNYIFTYNIPNSIGGK